MKRIIIRLLALLISLTFIMNMCVVVSADNVNEETNGIYLLSEVIPQGAIEHVQSSLKSLISDLISNGVVVSVGQPFKLSGSQNNLYYFVVYANNEMVGIYRVFETDDGYSGIFSEDTTIISRLMNLSDLTTAANPARIVVGAYNDLYAVVNNQVLTLIEDPFGNVTSPESLLSQPVLCDTDTIVNILDTIDVSFTPPISRTTPTWKYLQLDCLEIQTSLPWCAAYAAASILRFKTGRSLSEINASAILQYSYPDKTIEELEQLGISINHAMQYANQYGIYPSYVLHRRAYSAITDDIIADNPVMFVFDNLSSGNVRAHAMVCRGYYDNSGDSYYSIWNPWYTYYERIYTSDNIYYISATGEARYKWSATSYGWGY